MSENGREAARPMTRGLRARAREREKRVEGSMTLGSAKANAYFQAKKRQSKKPAGKLVPRKQKPPPLAERRALKQATASPPLTPPSPKQASTCPPPTLIVARQPEKQIERKRDAEEEKESSVDREERRKRRAAEVTAESPDEVDERLVLPAHGSMRATLKQTDALEEEQLEVRRERLVRLFPGWKSELLAGYNLLFYGMGSKLTLLQDFAASYLNDSLVVQLHGYLPTVSLRYLTSFIQEEVLQVSSKANRTLLQQCRDIAKIKSTPRGMVEHVYLLVHSIDGLALRTPETQTCLSWLAKAPFISLIASIEHINGPSIWKEEDSLRFEWLSQSLHTCAPYTDEVELRLAKRAKTADPTNSGVKFILQSLTPTDVSTLQQLARQQLAAAVATRSGRVKSKIAKLPVYQSVYEACRKKLLHLTLLSMKNSVKCLEDHGLLKRIRMHTIEYLEIPLPASIIRSEVLQLDPQE